MARCCRYVMLVLVGLAGAAERAHATYSIVATDADSGQVGGAGTSCVGSFDVAAIYGSAPGQGAIHAQASLSFDGRDEGVSLLEMSTAPSDVIAAITAPSFDSNAQRRQYGVVDLQGRAAGFTGSQNGSYAADRQGTLAAFTYSVQGNILTSAAVLDQSQAAFEASGCDLADRLMRALEAGADNGEGDSRCTPDGIPSDSAFIHVDDADGSVLLHLSVTDSGNVSPLIELRAQYDDWRETNPCPVAAPDAGPRPVDEDAGAGIDDTGGSDGCACRATSADASSTALALLMIVALWPRRARRITLDAVSAHRQCPQKDPVQDGDGA